MRNGVGRIAHAETTDSTSQPMTWDAVCILCGIRPFGGPTHLTPLISPTHVRRVAYPIVEEILASKLVDLPRPEVLSTLVEALTDADGDAHTLLEELAWLEPDCYAVGHFDERGDYELCKHHGAPLHPTGDAVTVRRVWDCISGTFGGLRTPTHLGLQTEAYATQNVEYRTTRCVTLTASTRNLFTHVSCYEHLQSWLRCSVPPRIGRSKAPLSFPGELYELVNSRTKDRVIFLGILPCIDYTGLVDNSSRDRVQDYILPWRKGCVHTARALRDGLRGSELVPSILKDCRAWMFTRPNSYVALSPLVLAASHSFVTVGQKERASIRLAGRTTAYWPCPTSRNMHLSPISPWSSFLRCSSSSKSRTFSRWRCLANNFTRRCWSRAPSRMHSARPLSTPTAPCTGCYLLILSVRNGN